MDVLRDAIEPTDGRTFQDNNAEKRRKEKREEKSSKAAGTNQIKYSFQGCDRVANSLVSEFAQCFHLLDKNIANLLLMLKLDFSTLFCVQLFIVVPATSCLFD